MLFRKPRKIEPLLDPVLDKLLVEMTEHDHDTKEYALALEQFERVCALRQANKMDSVNPNTLVQVIGTFCGILVIVIYEQKNVITTKALALIGIRHK